MRDAVIPVLLPMPNEEEIVGFMELYRTKYGKELDPVDALKMPSGLMRFLYLTNVPPLSEVKEGETEVVEQEEPLHPTQLTARKAGRSLKKK